MKNLTLILIFILSSNLLFAQTKNEPLTQLDKEFFSFFKKFREAIRKKDKEKLSDMIYFPFKITEFNGIEENPCYCIEAYETKFDFIYNNLILKCENCEDYKISYIYDNYYDFNLSDLLNKYLKYLDKIVSIGQKRVVNKKNLIVWVGLRSYDQASLDVNDRSLCCNPELNIDRCYELHVGYSDPRDEDNGEIIIFLHFCKIDDKYKLVTYEPSW